MPDMRAGELNKATLQQIALAPILATHHGLLSIVAAINVSSCRCLLLFLSSRRSSWPRLTSKSPLGSSVCNSTARWRKDVHFFQKTKTESLFSCQLNKKSFSQDTRNKVLTVFYFFLESHLEITCGVCVTYAFIKADHHSRNGRLRTGIGRMARFECSPLDSQSGRRNSNFCVGDRGTGSINKPRKRRRHWTPRKPRTLAVDRRRCNGMERMSVTYAGIRPHWACAPYQRTSAKFWLSDLLSVHCWPPSPFFQLHFFKRPRSTLHTHTRVYSKRVHLIITAIKFHQPFLHHSGCTQTSQWQSKDFLTVLNHAC